MKKQVVAILAIIAVITTLITVNALSNDVGYKVTPCDAIVISIGNATVRDFLNATNMTTVQVSDFKGYKGENTWRVQWSSSDRLLDVYVNIATGNIAGIEEQKNHGPSVQASETPRWHPVISFSMCYGATQPFTIKGEKWRVHYLSSATYYARNVAEEDGFSMSELWVSVFPKDETMDRVSRFRSSDLDCNRTQYIYRGEGKGSDNYYFNVTKVSNLDWWQILVEDYY